MKLEERLKELEPDTYVYLGNGKEGFFCISKVSAIEESLQMEINRQMGKLTHSLKGRKYRMSTLNQQITSLSTKMYEADGIAEVEDIKNQIKHCQNEIAFHEIKNAEILRKKNAISSPQKILECEIINECDRELSPPFGRIINVECPDVMSGYWFLREFEQGTKRKE